MEIETLPVSEKGDQKIAINLKPLFNKLPIWQVVIKIKQVNKWFPYMTYSLRPYVPLIWLWGCDWLSIFSLKSKLRVVQNECYIQVLNLHIVSQFGHWNRPYFSWPFTYIKDCMTCEVFLVSSRNYTLSIYRGLIPNKNAHSPTVTMAKLLSDFLITNKTPNITLAGEVWCVFRKFFKENWPRHIESALYDSSRDIVV